MSDTRSLTVILGTGGTIAGSAAVATDNVGYMAAQRGVGQLLAAVPALADVPLEAEQVAQLDSKDMDFAVWQLLARRVLAHLARPEVSGVVITHGTDTLEETAWYLHQVLAPAKPVVLVAAMRPATALAADGPQNLQDAVAVARWPGAQGVLAVMAGRVHAAKGLRKRHPYRIDAFADGDGAVLAWIEEGGLRTLRPWPQPENPPLSAEVRQALIDGEPGTWPWVEIVTSHAGARPDGVRALLAAGVQGLVVATTGNGSLHQALQLALDEAHARGVPVWLCTRCAEGVLVGPVAQGQPAADMTPWQARVKLVLRLLAERGGG